MGRAEDQPGARASRRRWVVSPGLSMLVALAWLLMQGSLAPASLLWAALLGLALPWLTRRFLGRYRRSRAPVAAVRLLLVVGWDIVRANLTVARIVLQPRRVPQPAWVWVPCSLRDPRAIALLATIVTNTPGTVSAFVDEKRSRILVHALDATEPDALVLEIHARYERLLKEIFE